MPNLTKQQVSCPHCRSITDWHQLTDGRYRCLECFSTIDAPKPVKSKAEAAPQPVQPGRVRDRHGVTNPSDPAAVRSAKQAPPEAVKAGKDWAAKKPASEGPALDRNRKR